MTCTVQMMNVQVKRYFTSRLYVNRIDHRTRQDRYQMEHEQNRNVSANLELKLKIVQTCRWVNTVCQIILNISHLIELPTKLNK